VIEVRRWSDHVLALYVPDGRFGRLLRIVDTSETVANTGFQEHWERMFGYDDDTSQDGRAGAQTPVDPGLAPNRAERSPMMHHPTDGCT
jgi:hypothetical protein